MKSVETDIPSRTMALLFVTAAPVRCLLSHAVQPGYTEIYVSPRVYTELYFSKEISLSYTMFTWYIHIHTQITHVYPGIYYYRVIY